MSYPKFALYAARATVSVAYESGLRTKEQNTPNTSLSTTTSSQKPTPSYYNRPVSPQSTISSSNLTIRFCFPNEFNFEKEIKKLYEKLKYANQVVVYSVQGRVKRVVRDIKKGASALHSELDSVSKASTRLNLPCSKFDLKQSISNLNRKLDDFIKRESIRPRRKPIAPQFERRRLFF